MYDNVYYNIKYIHSIYKADPNSSDEGDDPDEPDDDEPPPDDDEPDDDEPPPDDDESDEDEDEEGDTIEQAFAAVQRLIRLVPNNEHKKSALEVFTTAS